MIHPTKIRELILATGTTDERPAHLAAASGLTRARNTLYVVADDEHHLGVFHAASEAPGDLVRLFDGDLPEKPKKRKAAKPDLETLMTLPPFAGYAHGAMLALGSGSKPNRETGIVLGLNSNGLINTQPRQVDLARLYAALRQEIDGLNIEGAVLSGEDVVLLQRGNKGAANAIIRFALTPFLSDLGADTPPHFRDAFSLQTIDLGAVEGVPLCFTDGAALSDGTVLFTAVAEDTDNSVDDGACKGSVIGVLSAAGKILHIDRLSPGYKVEGIIAAPHASGLDARLVTDGDDASKPAWLLAAHLPWC